MSFNCDKAGEPVYEKIVYFVPLSSQKLHSFDRPGKDERLSRPWSHPVVLNT